MHRNFSSQLQAVLVATGGFGGAVARHGMDLLLGAGLTSTLTVNVLGATALGLLVGHWADRGTPGWLRALLATGFLSSFTTYSTFVLETVGSEPIVAGGYVALTYGLGFTAAAAGLATASLLDGDRR